MTLRKKSSNRVGGWIVGLFAIACGVGSAAVMARMENLSVETEQAPSE